MTNDILVFGEVRGGKLKKVTMELISAALGCSSSLGGAVDAVILGQSASKAAEEITEFGLRSIKICEDENLANYSTEGYATALVRAIEIVDPAYILLGATAMGRDLAPRAAARIDGAMFSDCVDLRVENGSLIAKRPVYSGKVYIEIERAVNKPIFLTIRPNNIPPAKKTGGKSAIERFECQIAKQSIQAIVKEIIPLAGGRPDVAEADIIVSGGRAMKDKSNFKILEDLADVLGGAVGASRAAVDAGYAPAAIQVGQTGKIVNPKLYIACGISGAIQHLAGMRTSKVIVAINKDPNAPIFERATYGIVGDLFEIVPILTEEIKKVLS